MKTVHAMIPDDRTGDIYCKATNKIRAFDELLRSGDCIGCLYFTGSAMGKGVECLYDDGSKFDDVITNARQYVESRKIVLAGV